MRFKRALPPPVRQAVSFAGRRPEPHINGVQGRLFPLFFGLPVIVSACSELDDDKDSDHPSSFTLVAASPDWPGSAGSQNVDFAVGLRAELRALDSNQYVSTLTAVRCVTGCRVDSLTSSMHPGSPAFRLTPLETRFRVQAEVVGRYGAKREAVPLDVELRAVDAVLSGDHRGPGPGVAFLTGTTIAWRLRPSVERIAWEPALSTIEVEGPVDVLDETRTSEGIDLRLRAWSPGKGRLVHRNGPLEVSHELHAVAPADIRSLHAAVADIDFFHRDAPTLRSALSDRIAVTTTEARAVWVVFETSGGVLGIAGAGESLPAAGASFVILPPADPANPYPASPPEPPSLAMLQSQPTIALQGKKLGTSTLTLRVGDAKGSVAVAVVR
jgi:hypothetical protein